MSMSHEQRMQIKNNSKLITNDLVVDETFLSHFLQENIVTEQMCEELLAVSTRHQRAWNFQRMLGKRGAAAYEMLIEALVLTGQSHVAALLCDVEEWKAKNPDKLVKIKSFKGNAEGGGGEPREVEDTHDPLINISILPSKKEWVKQMLSKEQEVYQMTRKCRGRCIILNNELFRGMSDRDGSVFDAVNLTELFDELHFNTETWKDLNNDEIHRKLFEERHHPDHRDADAFVFCILSHGNQGKIYTTDGKTINLDTIFSHFDGNQCPGLIGKPKVFLIQACQGISAYISDVAAHGLTRPDAACEPDAMRVPQDPEMAYAYSQPEINRRDTTETVPSIHEKADFIMAYSTVPGYKSWRNTLEGSWFIRDLCRTFMERAHCQHLEDMFKAINRKQENRVAVIRQVSEFRSSSRKNLYFFPGYTEP